MVVYPSERKLAHTSVSLINKHLSMFEQTACLKLKIRGMHLWGQNYQMITTNTTT